jgi:CcmD family protein
MLVLSIRMIGVSGMNTMPYLVAAYTAIWIILAVYLFSMHSREMKLREEIERLKQLVGK